MAARRLIAILVVLLVVSSIAAAVAPEAERAPDESSTSSESTSETPTNTAPPQGEEGSEPRTGPQASGKPRGGGVPGLIETTIAVPAAKEGAGQAKDADEPSTVDAAIGDQLSLIVDADRTVGVEIPSFGLYETASSESPARFDLILRERGSYAIRTDDGTEVATIRVGEKAATAEPRDPPDAAPDADDNGGAGSDPAGPGGPQPQPQPEPGEVTT